MLIAGFYGCGYNSLNSFPILKICVVFRSNYSQYILSLCGLVFSVNFSLGLFICFCAVVLIFVCVLFLWSGAQVFFMCVERCV